MKYSCSEITQEKILKAGVELWPDVSLANVARACGIGHSAILYHYPRYSLQDAIACYAVKEGISKVIVQLIATEHPCITTLTTRERESHLRRFV